MPLVLSFVDGSFSMGDEERSIGRDRSQDHTDLRRDYGEVGLPHAIDLPIEPDACNTGDGDQDHDSCKTQRECQWNLLSPFDLNFPDKVDGNV